MADIFPVERTRSCEARPLEYSGLAVANRVVVGHVAMETLMSHQETRRKICVDEKTLDQGHRICRLAVKQSLVRITWMVSNLPGDRKAALNALLNHMIRVIDYLDLESTNGLPLDVWCEFRDDLSDAFMDRYASADLAALVDACRKFNVPRQYLFDMLDGADCWIRNRRFNSYDDLLVFAYRIGGAAMLAAVPILGFVKHGYEQSAIHAGQSILLTQILANMVQDLKLHRVFFAEEDIRETGVPISRVMVRQPSDGLKHLVRLYGARIEKLMVEGGRLIEYLDFDARRSFTSLMALHFEMQIRMRLRPEIVLQPQGVLSARDMFNLKARHFLGLERKVPIISTGQSPH